MTRLVALPPSQWWVGYAELEDGWAVGLVALELRHKRPAPAPRPTTTISTPWPATTARQPQFLQFRGVPIRMMDALHPVSVLDLGLMVVGEDARRFRVHRFEIVYDGTHAYVDVDEAELTLAPDPRQLVADRLRAALDDIRRGRGEIVL